MNYFQLRRGVRFLRAHIKSTVDDTLNFYYPLTRAWSIYVCYAFCKAAGEEIRRTSSSGKVESRVFGPKSAWEHSLGQRCALYIWSRKDGSTNWRNRMFINNPSKSSRFHPTSFHFIAYSSSMELCQVSRISLRPECLLFLRISTMSWILHWTTGDRSNSCLNPMQFFGFYLQYKKMTGKWKAASLGKRQIGRTRMHIRAEEHALASLWLLCNAPQNNVLNSARPKHRVCEIKYSGFVRYHDGALMTENTHQASGAITDNKKGENGSEEIKDDASYEYCQEKGQWHVRSNLSGSLKVLTAWLLLFPALLRAGLCFRKKLIRHGSRASVNHCFLKFSVTWINMTKFLLLWVPWWSQKNYVDHFLMKPDVLYLRNIV